MSAHRRPARVTDEWPLPSGQVQPAVVARIAVVLGQGRAARVTTPGRHDAWTPGRRDAQTSGEARGAGSTGVRVGWRTRALAHTRGRRAR
ncbi:MAG: hypothetical protein ACRDNF_01045 [Streptosporangiaceae bacterium]